MTRSELTPPWPRISRNLVDVREVVAGNLARHGSNPDFPTQLAVVARVGNLVRLVDDLGVSHDKIYYG